MKYGVFSSVYGAYKIDEAADKIKAAGFDAVQFVPFAVERKTVDPRKVSERTIKRYRKAFESRGLEIVGISGGYAFLTPDEEQNRQSVETTKAWVKWAPVLGTDLVITEIGSKHPTHNWTDHPDNYTEETWQQVVAIYRDLTSYAKEFGVNIGIEPHFASVLKWADDLRRVLDDVGADNLKIVFDAANSVTADNVEKQPEILKHFYEILGDDIILAHGKDTALAKGTADFVPAGKGVLPYRAFLNVLKENGYQRPLILEYLEEKDVEETLEFLKEQETAPFMVPLFRADRELFYHSQAALDLVHGEEGALELKYRLLLSMVADALTRHPAGAAACAKEALEAGATKEEVTEAFRVVYTAGGLPSLIENFDVYREVLLK